VQVDVNPDGPNRLLTDSINDGSPVFSPDGRYLAVVSGTPGGGAGYDIHRLNADGGGRVQLTKTPLWVTSVPGNQKAWNNVAPAWSPDGSQIAFLTDRTGRWEIWVMNADGSDPRPLFSDEINDQLDISYNFVDERVLSWG
jgi:Tol biopolymer transport system component